MLGGFARAAPRVCFPCPFDCSAVAAFAAFGFRVRSSSRLNFASSLLGSSLRAVPNADAASVADLHSGDLVKATYLVGSKLTTRIEVKQQGPQPGEATGTVTAADTT